MPYKVLPVLMGTLMFSPTFAASNSKGNFEEYKANTPAEASKQDLNLLEEVHNYSNIFDDPQMGSTPYQFVNENENH